MQGVDQTGPGIFRSDDILRRDQDFPDSLALGLRVGFAVIQVQSPSHQASFIVLGLRGWRFRRANERPQEPRDEACENHAQILPWCALRGTDLGDSLDPTAMSDSVPTVSAL